MRFLMASLALSHELVEQLVTHMRIGCVMNNRGLGFKAAFAHATGALEHKSPLVL
ncbi:MAG: hypothetical protein AAGK37_20245 [Pseudomonadota bacterium]